MIRRNKEQALSKKLEVMEDREMVETLERVEGEEQEKIKRQERLKRAGKQQRDLLEEIRIKAARAKSRLQDRESKELAKALARERRLSRAAIQRNSTLDKLHQMDWSTTAILEEGEGKRMEKERVEPFDLIAANSVGWERKRKRGKKLRWSTEARRKAGEKGLIARNWKRARSSFSCHKSAEWRAS